ncbi:hypothetical protein BSNT_08556 [Bacillus subtilis subsp. natto BEST195]|nr:hypothetical protein BSNT_08556 [Bacillus subtilis subsp. natto BEST195]
MHHMFNFVIELMKATNKTKFRGMIMSQSVLF